MRQSNHDTYRPDEAATAAAVRDDAAGGGDLLAAMNESKRRGRGAQKAPTKLLITLRLDREAVARYRATGKGWQSRISEDVRKAAFRQGRRRTTATRKRTKRQGAR
jgi:uncharacterized protein (DUF4415 family)